MPPTNCSICHRTNTALGSVGGLNFCRPEAAARNPGAVTPCEATARHRAVNAAAVKNKAAADAEMQRAIDEDFARDLEAE